MKLTTHTKSVLNSSSDKIRIPALVSAKDLPSIALQEASPLEKGVGFILYLNDKASVNHDLDKLFKTCFSWGAAGVKCGFMENKGKDKVIKTLRIVELAAKHQLLINFHDGPIIPRGLRKA